MNRSVAGFVAVALLAVAPLAGASVVYSLDDGVSENAVGLTSGGTITVANQFTVVAGGEAITDILIAFGSLLLPGPFPNGSAVTAKLWSDPNGDGNPADAVLLASVNGVSASLNTDTFVSFAIPAVTLGIGTNFFAGVTLSHAAGEFPFGVDQTAPTTSRSWITDGGDFAGGSFVGILSSFGLGDAMIRARASAAAAVPEPGTAMLLASLLALGGVARRRRAGR